MKILIDPTLSLLIKDFSDAQCAELLRCILEYPNRDCNLGVWQYMKKQIEESEKKYIAKCQRMAELRERKCSLKSVLKSEKKTDLKSDEESVVIKEKVKVKENITKENIIESSESSNAEKIVEKPGKFIVDKYFSFKALGIKYPKFNDYIALFPPSVVERAEQTFIRKRIGQTVEMPQILEWLEKEHAFYKTNKGL